MSHFMNQVFFVGFVPSVTFVSRRPAVLMPRAASC